MVLLDNLLTKILSLNRPKVVIVKEHPTKMLEAMNTPITQTLIQTANAKSTSEQDVCLKRISKNVEELTTAKERERTKMHSRSSSDESKKCADNISRRCMEDNRAILFREMADRKEIKKPKMTATTTLMRDTIQ